MSTADSQMLAASSSVSENIVCRLLHEDIPTKTQMWIARGTTLLIAIIGVVFAWDPNASIFRIVSFAWAGFGAAFGPLVLFALFWRRTNKWGALAGMLTGGIMVFVWKFGIAKLHDLLAVYELLPAFVISSIAIVLVSLLTEKPSAEVEADFDAVVTGDVEATAE
jgi:sodium/proline symporter